VGYGSKPDAQPIAESANIPTPPTEKTMAYWAQQLAGASTVLDLPTDFPRSANQGKRVARAAWSFGEKKAAEICALANGGRTSFESILLAAFSVLLSRYSAQTDILIGLVSAEQAALDPAPLVIRIEINDASFEKLVQRTHLTIDEACGQGAIPLRRLAGLLGVAENTSHAPIIQAICINADEPKPASACAKIAPSDSQFDLVLRITSQRQLAGEIIYDVDLYKHTTIERMVTHLATILNGALSAPPDTPAPKLPLMPAHEYQQVVFDWNAISTGFPLACAHQMFEQQVTRTPDAPAVVFGEQRLTYVELNRKANQLAHYLIKHNVSADVLVGVCVKRSIDMVIALLGILKAGGAYVPLDPAYPPDRLSYMIADAKPAILLAQESLLNLLNSAGREVLCLDRDWPLVARESQENAIGVATADTLAYVIYTSGSTGKPKGVALEHRGLSNLCVAQADAFDVDQNSQVLQFASISFDAAVSETFVTLTKGACLHLIRQEALRSAYEIISLMEKSAISVVTLPPSLLAVLPRKPLPALKTLVLAGEAWPPELARNWGSGRRMLNAYGPTEGTVCATWFKADTSLDHSVPIGKPLANVKIYILDEHFCPVPIGVPGELYIAGPGLARGYLHRPELTKERFVTNPFCHEYSGRMYRTGDKAKYLEDGNIEFLGRIDNQIKLRGYRIELGEIEATLTTHEAIGNAVVIVREDHPGEKRLVAYVIATSEVTISTLKLHLKATLPDYMVPQNFVFLDALPMSPNGKVDRKALPSPTPQNI